MPNRQLITPRLSPLLTAYTFPKGALRLAEDVGHRVVLEERKKLVVTGVSEVLRFQEDGALLQTAGGLLEVRGQGLQLKLLRPDGGQICVEGSVEGLSYEAARQGRFWARLFG